MMVWTIQNWITGIESLIVRNKISIQTGISTIAFETMELVPKTE